MVNCTEWQNKPSPFPFLLLFFLPLPLLSFLSSPFFPSSDPMFKKNDAAALKDIDTFVFLFSLQMDKSESTSIIDLFNQELSKVGRVVKKEIFTDQGVDIDCFSNHRLQFSTVK